MWVLSIFHNLNLLAYVVSSDKSPVRDDALLYNSPRCSDFDDLC